jgi:hypothetical protein
VQIFSVRGVGEGHVQLQQGLEINFTFVRIGESQRFSTQFHCELIVYVVIDLGLCSQQTFLDSKFPTLYYLQLIFIQRFVVMIYLSQVDKELDNHGNVNLG